MTREEAKRRLFMLKRRKRFFNDIQYFRDLYEFEMATENMVKSEIRYLTELLNTATAPQGQKGQTQ